MNRVAVAVATVVARLFSVPRARRAQLFDLISALDCPVRFLEELAATVGFTRELRASTYPEGEEWRAIITFAPAIWESKGEHETLRDIIRAFVGARSWIGDWHNFRTQAGVSTFPFFGTTVWTSNGDWVSNIHVEDRDAVLDRNRTVDALDVVRNGGEVLEVTFIEFLENWDNLFRWTIVGAATLGTQVLDLDGTAAAASATTAEGSTRTDRWTEVHYNSLLRITSGDSVRFRFRDDLAGDFYEVRLDEGGAAGNVELFRGAASVAVGTHGIPSFATKAILLTVLTVDLVTGIQIEVLIDGTSVITHTDATPAGTGEAGFRVDAGNIARCEWFEVVPANPDTRTVPA